MADIVVEELMNYGISGADLFDDSESFMVELEDTEQVIGGFCKGLSFIGTGPICAGANGGWGAVTCGISQRVTFGHCLGFDPIQ
jgi:hypothetical protein